MNPANSLPRDIPPDADGPHIERIRHGVRLRSLRVADVARPTPGMLRITLAGDDLADFASLGFDDHVKLLAPTPSGAVERRDYTPRRWDPRARTLTIDFAVHDTEHAAGHASGHDGGPATRWALGARPGDRIEVAGPKGSAVVSPGVRRWLLVGDETALPAIGRRIEEAEAGTRITAVVAVAGPGEHQAFDTAAALTMAWVHRPPSGADDAGALLQALRAVDLESDTFVWIAAEAGVARAVRDHVLRDRRHPPGWTKAAGYWVKGRADAHERIG